MQLKIFKISQNNEWFPSHHQIRLTLEELSACREATEKLYAAKLKEYIALKTSLSPRCHIMNERLSQINCLKRVNEAFESELVKSLAEH